MEQTNKVVANFKGIFTIAKKGTKTACRNYIAAHAAVRGERCVTITPGNLKKLSVRFFITNGFFIRLDKDRAEVLIGRNIILKSLYRCF
jgi:hypothetical protein